MMGPDYTHWLTVEIPPRERFAVARENRPIFHQAMRFGNIGRDKVRRETIATALEMLRRMMA